MTHLVERCPLEMRKMPFGDISSSGHNACSSFPMGSSKPQPSTGLPCGCLQWTITHSIPAGLLPPASSDPPLGLSIPGQNISQQTNFDPESLFPKLSMTPSCPQDRVIASLCPQLRPHHSGSARFLCWDITSVPSDGHGPVVVLLILRAPDPKVSVPFKRARVCRSLLKQEAMSTTRSPGAANSLGTNATEALAVCCLLQLLQFPLPGNTRIRFWR